MRVGGTWVWVVVVGLVAAGCGRTRQPGDDLGEPMPAGPGPGQPGVVQGPFMMPGQPEPAPIGGGGPVILQPQPASPTPAQCFEQTSQDVSEGCRDCACSVAPECPMLVSACDDQCWALILCVGEYCPQGPDQDVTSCAIENCADFIGAATAARAAADCARPCAFDCGVQGLAGMPDVDAGAVDASIDEDAGV